jgi:hypothetical protein
MKNKTILGILLFSMILINETYSQMEYFDSVYHFTPWNSWDFARNVIEVEDGYLIQGQTPDQYDSYWYRMAYTKIDKQGNQLWSKTYGDTIAEWLIGRPGCFVKSSAGGYYSAGTKRTPTEDWVHDEGMIIRYDDELDTLWTKFHGDLYEPWDTAYMLMQMKQLENYDLVFIGLTGAYGEAVRIYLLKTDSLGNKIWDHVYGTGGTRYYYAYSVVQTSDGGFAIGGEYAILGQYQSEQPIIIKVDSLGNKEWIETFGSQYNEFRTVVTLSNDGKITAGSILSDSSFGSTSYVGRIRILKLNNDGSIIWDKLYGERKRNSKTHSIMTLQDGSIISSGYYVTDNYPHIVGWILKVSSEGDSIWMREYDRANLSIYSNNKLFDVKPTSDGGLIACGDIHPHLPDTGNQDAWVIKLDSIGCDTPGCDTTVAIPEIAYKKKHNDLYIYPNPAHNVLNIIYPITNNECRSIISIYDVFGRKVKEIKVPKGQNEVITDVNKWNRGIYIAVLWQNGKLIAKEKFMIIR